MPFRVNDEVLFMKKVTLSRSRGGQITMFIVLALFGAFVFLPLYYSIITAFKPLTELFIFPPRFFVRNPTLDNFKNFFILQAQSTIPMTRYIFNSIFVAFASTFGYVIIASMAAYPLAKHNFSGKKIITTMVVFAILFNGDVTGIPRYIIISELKLLDTFWAMILPAMAGSFGVFLMQQFMSVIPGDVIESARIDGASESQIFFKIVQPMVRPARLTLVIFTFIGVWNIGGIEYTYSENMKMLPVMLAQLTASGISRAGIASAISVLLLIPPVIIFTICQNSVVETMAYSGIKE